MRLITDFRDYYDHAFDTTGVGLLRRMTDGPTRFEALTWLKQLYGTPKFAYAWNLSFDAGDEVVVHFKEGHAGEGKLRARFRDALVAAPDAVVVQYHPESRGRSVRLLVIGEHVYWLEYRAFAWRSNDDPVITTCAPVVDYDPELSRWYPLYAVDFIETRDGWKAIDLNVSPGLRHTPVRDILSPTEVVDAIKRGVTPYSKTIVAEDADA